jgi:hypothetical protein
MKHYPPDVEMDQVLDILNLLFTGVFAFEALFKVIEISQFLLFFLDYCVKSEKLFW